MKKAILYYSLASNQSIPDAQINLGLIYYNGDNCKKDMKRGKFYIELASKNGSRTANFSHGFLLHTEGKIEEAIKYYKEASSFNNSKAKNNLGIIYKNGYKDKVKARIGDAIIYFKEAIRQKNDVVAMYNLAHLYAYNERMDDKINESIELLIKSSNSFIHSMLLLFLLLIKQFGFDMNTIKNQLDKYQSSIPDFSSYVSKAMYELDLFDRRKFENYYEKYSKFDFLYNINEKPFPSFDLEFIGNLEEQPTNTKAKDISNLFYEGFENL